MPNTAPLPLRFAARLAVSLAMALPIQAAWAQWQWVDNTGRKVFSDTAPPAGIPEKNILKRPGGAVLPVAPAAPAEASATAPASPGAPAVPRAADKDKELEARMKQAEATEEAKRKAEAERVAKARAENCERARRAVTTLDGGGRIAITNAKGEREFMDDKARAAERQRAEQIVRSDCGPLPAQ